ncbi:hypothetical protein [Candidatus Nitrosotalea bavarica]|uniref:hypothetical protein n=1 Tax=Candidatus Nitrosotalea bavarica TaxID=1903277 RepID=UPI0013FD4B02|nr:hypothetical protein [Candidatus Nitrosotalea bavarica]
MTGKDQVKKETTSIKVDPNLWKKAKIRAVETDMDLSDLVEKALKAWLKDE